MRISFGEMTGPASNTRQQDTCPVCGDKMGRIEQGEIDGQSARYYVHTDLSEIKEYCVENCDGKSAQVKRGNRAFSAAD